jgi:hypothetical protein
MTRTTLKGTGTLSGNFFFSAAVLVPTQTAAEPYFGGGTCLDIRIVTTCCGSFNWRCRAHAGGRRCYMRQVCTTYLH